MGETTDERYVRVVSERDDAIARGARLALDVADLLEERATLCARLDDLTEALRAAHASFTVLAEHDPPWLDDFCRARAAAESTAATLERTVPKFPSIGDTIYIKARGWREVIVHRVWMADVTEILAKDVDGVVWRLDARRVHRQSVWVSTEGMLGDPGPRVKDPSGA